MALIEDEIEYYRSTDFPFRVTVNPPSPRTVLTGLFTVKTQKFDDNSTDSSALLQKTVPATDNQIDFSIAHDDFGDTTEPGSYYYSVHVILDNGDILPFASGKFLLRATTTNRES